MLSFLYSSWCKKTSKKAFTEQKVRDGNYGNLLLFLVVVLERVGSHGDVSTGVSAFLAFVLLVAEVLAAHCGQHLVRLGAVPVLAELVHV